MVPPQPASFETRNVGYTVEWTPAYDGRDQSVYLNLNLEHVSYLGDSTWGYDRMEVEVPDFYTLRTTTHCKVTSGKSRLLSTHEPSSEFKSDRKRPRILVFVRANVLDPESKAADEEALSDQMSYCFEYLETSQERLSELLGREEIGSRGPALHEALLGDISEGNGSGS